MRWTVVLPIPDTDGQVEAVEDGVRLGGARRDERLRTFNRIALSARHSTSGNIQWWALNGAVMLQAPVAFPDSADRRQHHVLVGLAPGIRDADLAEVNRAVGILVSQHGAQTDQLALAEVIAAAERSQRAGCFSWRRVT